MKKGINIWSFKWYEYNECITMAQDAGFEGIELVWMKQEKLPRTAKKDILQIKRQQDAGIEIQALATGLYWSYPITSSDPRIRQKSKEIVKKQLEIAALLGADCILVVPVQ